MGTDVAPLSYYAALAQVVHRIGTKVNKRGSAPYDLVQQYYDMPLHHTTPRHNTINLPRASYLALFWYS